MNETPLAQLDGIRLDGLEFCSRVYRLYESIRYGVNGPSRMRRRPSRVEKKLLDELMPICTYLQASYGPGRFIDICWIDANQQCDAELFQRGACVDEDRNSANAFLEVTCVMHENEYLVRELLDTEGRAFGPDGVRRIKGRAIESVPKPYKGTEFIDSYSKLLCGRIAEKAKRPFPKNTTLIVQCTLNMPYSPDEWAALIATVRQTVPEWPFREIYCYDTLAHHTVRLFRQCERSGR